MKAFCGVYYFYFWNLAPGLKNYILCNNKKTAFYRIQFKLNRDFFFIKFVSNQGFKVCKKNF
jgi:hypothetical protein